MRKVKCELCGQEITVNQLPRHLERHEKHPESFVKSKYSLNHDGLTCQFCGKECKNRNSLCNHERLCKQNPNRQDTSSNKKGHPAWNKGIPAWNRGLTKETDARVAYCAQRLNESIQERKERGTFVSYGKSLDPEKENKRREKLSKIMSEKHYGKSRTSLCGWYHDIWCDSTWELAFIIYAEDHQIDFIRNRESFEFLWKGCIHNYTPDFYLPEEDCYIEIKGFNDYKSQEKIKQFPKNILLYTKEQMRPILNYVVQKYGDKFADLYEDKDISSEKSV